MPIARPSFMIMNIIQYSVLSGTAIASATDFLWVHHIISPLPRIGKKESIGQPLLFASYLPKELKYNIMQK